MHIDEQIQVEHYVECLSILWSSNYVEHGPLHKLYCGYSAYVFTGEVNTKIINILFRAMIKCTLSIYLNHGNRKLWRKSFRYFESIDKKELGLN